MRLNEATPLSSQATASPSMMQERERRRAQGLDDQREATGEIVARTAVEPHMRAGLAGNDPEASCLISCSHWLLSVLVGRHGAMNSAGRVRCNIMAIVKGYSCVSQPFFIARLALWDTVGLPRGYLTL
jgi:hypothetical protein